MQLIKKILIFELRVFIFYFCRWLNCVSTDKLKKISNSTSEEDKEK